MTAISVNRLPALFLGLRYKQVLITESTSIILAAVWALTGVSALWNGYTCVTSCLVISIGSFSGEINKCTEHFAIQKGGIQHFHPVNRHWRVSSNLTLLQLNIKSVSLMLED